MQHARKRLYRGLALMCFVCISSADGVSAVRHGGENRAACTH